MKREEAQEEEEEEEQVIVMRERESLLAGMKHGNGRGQRQS